MLTAERQNSTDRGKAHASERDLAAAEFLCASQAFLPYNLDTLPHTALRSCSYFSQDHNLQDWTVTRAESAATRTLQLLAAEIPKASLLTKPVLVSCNSIFVRRSQLVSVLSLLRE